MTRPRLWQESSDSLALAPGPLPGPTELVRVLPGGYSRPWGWAVSKPYDHFVPKRDGDGSHASNRTCPRNPLLPALTQDLLSKFLYHLNYPNSLLTEARSLTSGPVAVPRPTQ